MSRTEELDPTATLPRLPLPRVSRRVAVRQSMVLVGALAGASLAACARGGPQPAPKPLGSKENPIKMAIVPFLETQKLTVGMRSIADALEKETGYTITSEVTASYVAAVEAMCAGKIDVNWLSPFPYVVANNKCGAQMVLVSVNRNNQTSYRGMILVRADSGINDLQDLRGKRFAWVDPGSTSGYLYPRALLMERGINPDTFFSQQITAGGHDKVIIAIMNRQVDAGAVYDDARTVEGIQAQFPKIMEETKVLAYTAEIPNDGVAVRKDMPQEVVQKIVQALLKISSTPEGKKLFYDAIGTYGVAPITDAAYDPVRRAAKVLNLDLEAELRKLK